MALNTIYILISAFCLDLFFGDPKWMPHLIVFYGKAIAFGEKKLNKSSGKLLKGMLLSMVLISLAFVVPLLMIQWLNSNGFKMLSILFSIVMLFYCLANKTLIQEGKAVFKTLKKEGLDAGRKRLSWIVGRETNRLDKQQIRIATFETMSENLSDGVIAPLFYFAILGIPGVMTYKMINTLDSMIGYKNDRYIQFGKFAAKVDDVVNYIPARITAFLILIVKFKLGGFFFVLKEGKKHSSPNAGYPEAALAYVLNCQFGGPNYYHGKLVEKPFIGSNNREIKHEEIKTVSLINYAVSTLFCILIIALFFVFYNG